MADISLSLSSEEFSIYSLAPSAELPRQVFAASFYSITRTADELSVVCPSQIVLSSRNVQTGWAILKVNGLLDFSLTGVLSGISTVLAREKISIFAISTYDTDYIMIRKVDSERAAEALAKSGYFVDKPNE